MRSRNWALRGVVIAVAATLAGCAVVKINHDATDSVEHSGGEETGKELANRACHKAGGVRAEVISTVQKDEAAQGDKARYVTTFRCLY
ncbi:hypothetical protein ACFPN2_34725 [Steroidobacter flavus]|uniref:Lipoprotein n=1 Tax=Steroidobacter flavus TaxID=1842136 RepID=A0ABV8T2T3_9GAMM